MRHVEFHPKAQEEFIAAARFYEAKAPNLGTAFIRSVQHTATTLLEFPERGRQFGGRLRRVLVPGFPYGLLYKAQLERIYVVAVANLHRRPGYWCRRA